VIGGIMFSAIFMIGGDLVADIMLIVLDPRIRRTEADAL
jgi:ABC-type dipeptide/oligopeptide/nickel transport system permease component